MDFQVIGGLVTGILFGILLQRSEVIRYDRQVGAVRLLDMTIVKFMLSAIIVGMIGLYYAVGAGLAELSVKGAVIGTNVTGGLIFGAGWAMLGYCPGTAAGALGEGRTDAIAGLVGMVFGGMLYGEFYPLTQKGILAAGDLGKVTLPDITGMNPWIWIFVLSLLYLGFFYSIEKMKL